MVSVQTIFFLNNHFTKRNLEFTANTKNLTTTVQKRQKELRGAIFKITKLPNNMNDYLSDIYKNSARSLEVNKEYFWSAIKPRIQFILRNSMVRDLN